MNKVAILTDSTADLSNEILNELKIYKLPLYVNINNNVYKDGVDITTSELYKKVSETGELPQTAAPSPGDFHKIFKELIDLDYDIIYIGIGASLSGTFQIANIAKQEFPENRIHLIDSMNLSSGIALLVLKAVYLRDKGLGAIKIKEEIEKLVPLVRSQFAIKTLNYLHKGGRATLTQKLLGSMLLIKPIVEVRNGKMDSYKKTMGKMSRALDVMLDDLFTELGNNNLDLEYVMVTHSLADKSVSYMVDKINKKFSPKNLIISEAGCVISSHCGEGTIGVLYIVKQ